MRTWIKILIPLKLKGILLHWSQDFIWNWNWLETDCKINLNWASSSKPTSRLVEKSKSISYFKSFPFHYLIWINYRKKEIGISGQATRRQYVTFKSLLKVTWGFEERGKQVGMVSVLCLHTASLCLRGAYWAQPTGGNRVLPPFVSIQLLALITPERVRSLSFWCVCMLCLVG